MLSSPLIVFTDKVTDRQTDTQTKVITIPHHKICEGVIKKKIEKIKQRKIMIMIKREQTN